MENKLKQLQENFKNISKRTDLVFNEKFLLTQIQELEEEIILLMQELPTNKTILRIDKYKNQINVYSKQLESTKKQIKTINGKFN
jgi:hypothetical protein